LWFPTHAAKNKNAAWMGHPAFLGLAGLERDFVALVDF
jgi:hypothetical protein